MNEITLKTQCGCEDHHEHAHNHEQKQQDTIGGRVLFMEGLNCANCGGKIQEALLSREDVEFANFDVITQKLQIKSSIADETALIEMVQTVTDAIEEGVTVKPFVRPVNSKSDASKAQHSHADLGSLHFIAIALGAIAIILEMTTSLLKGSVGIAFMIFVYLILGWPTLSTAAKNLLKGQIFDEHFLMTIATGGAMIIGEYPEAIGVMLFYQVGELFEERATAQSRSAVMDTIDMRPEIVRLIANDGVREIPAADAQVGDIVEVRVGDRIPLDGIVVEGASNIDTAPVTGEPKPITVAVNDKVISGCVNQSGRILIRVEKELSESMVTRILDVVENATANKPRLDRFISRFARVYTPIVVAVALITAIVPSLITGEWSYWIYAALTFLVVSCPCALVLSVPLAFFAGIGAGSRRGILFKGGLAIEALSKVKAVAFDKTGTITTGEFTVQKVETAPTLGITTEELLSLSAALESTSTHPIAQSIVVAAQQKALLLQTPSAVEEISGEGMRGQVGTQVVACGNRRLMQRFNIQNFPTEAAKFGSEVLVAIDGQYAGRIIISDCIKSDSNEAITRLTNAGLTTIMLTGDGKENAEFIAKEAGVSRVSAGLLPENKYDELKNLRNEYGEIMFVGDGINDAPVLAGADVGIAMGSGADAAIEAADVVIMNSNISAVGEAWSISKETIRVAWQNVYFAIIVKIAVMIFGFVGHASMWIAVFGDTGVTVLCILNAIRLLYKDYKG